MESIHDCLWKTKSKSFARVQYYSSANALWSNALHCHFLLQCFSNKVVQTIVHQEEGYMSRYLASESIQNQFLAIQHTSCTVSCLTCKKSKEIRRQEEKKRQLKLYRIHKTQEANKMRVEKISLVTLLIQRSVCEWTLELSMLPVSLLLSLGQEISVSPEHCFQITATVATC